MSRMAEHTSCEGINDIGRLHEANLPNYKLTAEDIEQGFAQLVVRAHEHGTKVFDATYKGAGYFTENDEQILHAINHWILTSGVLDGAIEFDKAAGEPANPSKFALTYDTGDHLHPKEEGYAAMADSVDISLFH
jgi:lysophospholipase L1-like esterase